MDDLIKKLESAEYGSRGFDRQIHEGVFDYEVCDGPADDPVYKHRDDVVWYNVPHYTTSLDAALTLVPEGWEWTINGGYLPTRYYAQVCNRGLIGEPSFVTDVRPTTAPVALCIVALKAGGYQS